MQLCTLLLRSVETDNKVNLMAVTPANAGVSFHSAQLSDIFPTGNN